MALGLHRGKAGEQEQIGWPLGTSKQLLHNFGAQPTLGHGNVFISNESGWFFSPVDFFSPCESQLCLFSGALPATPAMDCHGRVLQYPIPNFGALESYIAFANSI